MKNTKSTKPVKPRSEGKKSRPVRSPEEQFSRHIAIAIRLAMTSGWDTYNVLETFTAGMRKAGFKFATDAKS